jgi:hypothetical protein
MISVEQLRKIKSVDYYADTTKAEIYRSLEQHILTATDNSVYLTMATGYVECDLSDCRKFLLIDSLNESNYVDISIFNKLVQTITVELVALGYVVLDIECPWSLYYDPRTQDVSTLQITWDLGEDVCK